MSKFVNIFCLVLWGIQLVIGIMAACGLMTISPVSYICAVIMCIIYFADNLIRDE